MTERIFYGLSQTSERESCILSLREIDSIAHNSMPWYFLKVQVPFSIQYK